MHTFASYVGRVSSVAFAPDSRWVLWAGKDTTVRLYELDWEYDFPSSIDWDDGARPYLEAFLTLHCPIGKDGLSRFGKPLWSKDAFENLLLELQLRGYGWLRPDGVRQQLQRMAAAWQGPPPMPGIESK
jgi:WD40 repeat protein